MAIEPMYSIYSRLKTYWHLIGVTILFSLLGGGLSTLLLRQIHKGIDKSSEFELAPYILAFIALLASYFLVSMISAFTISLLNKRFVHNLRLELASKVLRLNYERIENIKTHLLPILTKDINQITGLFSSLPHTLTSVSTVLGIVAYLFYLSIPLGFLTLAAFAVLGLSNHLMMKKVGRYAVLSRTEDNKIFSHFEGLIYGISSLMMNTLFTQHYVHQGLNEASEKQTFYYFKHSLLNAFNNKLNDLILLGFLGGVLWSVHYAQWITIDFFSTYLTLILFVLSPLSKLSSFLGIMKNIKASLLQFEQVGLDLNQNESKFQSISRSNIAHSTPWSSDFEIKLKNISFEYRYVEHSFQIKKVDLTLRSGNVYFIEGGNGSGKSTLIKIICGLYEPKEGQIEVNNQVVDPNSISDYRNHFAVILTDSFVFDNMTHLNEEQLQNAAFFLKLTEMNEKITIDSKGHVSTKHLSAGQLKRLQMVQALLEDKEVYIFDEWVAYQDQHSKKIFYEKILPFLKENGRLVINIAHDYTFEKMADTIIKMEDGSVIEVLDQEVRHPAIFPN